MKNRIILILATCLVFSLGILLINQAVAQDCGSSGAPPKLDEDILKSLVPYESSGTSFDVSSAYFPAGLTIQSSESIHLVLTVLTSCVSLYLEPAPDTTKTETVITISGLAPLWNNNPTNSYWRYQDGLPFASIAKHGTYAWTQDLSRHVIALQPQHNTIFIGLEAKVPPETPPEEYADYYTYDSATRTYTLINNVYDSMVIVADAITLDAAGHTIAPPFFGASIGLFGRTGVTIQNATAINGIEDFFGSQNAFIACVLEANLTLFSSDHIDVISNTISSIYGVGVMLIFEPSFITIDGNDISSGLAGIAYLGSPAQPCRDIRIINNLIHWNDAGVAISGGLNINLIGNRVTNNKTWNGVWLIQCDNNLISENTITGNKYGLYLHNCINNKIFRNNIWSNAIYNVASIDVPEMFIVIPPLNPATQPPLPIELSYQGQGNFWGHTEPPGFYAYGEPKPWDIPYDSNDFQVVDSYPYLIQNGWERAPEITITSPQPRDYLNLESITIDFTIIDPIPPGLKNYQVYLDNSQFLDGVLLDQGVQIPLINLLLGEHTLRVLASDEANNRGVASVVFRVVSATQMVATITTDIRTMIDDPNVPAKARKVLENALELLIGANEGQANNGALDKLADGDLIAAFTKIWQVIKKLKQAQALGVSTEALQQNLCNLLKQLVQSKLAAVEAIYGVDHPDAIRIRNAFDRGVTLYEAGEYAEAARQFKLGQQKISELDKDGPVITFVLPEPREFFGIQIPPVLVIYADYLTTIRTSSIRVWVDGVDYTSSATITESELKLTPPPLEEGTHTLTVSVSDAGKPANTSIASINFGIDLTPSLLTIDYPTEGITLTNRDQIYDEISYSDGGSGINPKSLKVLLNGKDITQVFDKTITEATYHPQFCTMEGLNKWRRVHWASLDGDNELIVKIADNVGNVQEEIRHFAITQETIHIPAASAQHHKAWFEPVEWYTIQIKAVKTPKLYQPELEEGLSSTVTVTGTTQGTFTLSYTDVSGAPTEVQRIIEIDNITRAISYDGSTVTTVQAIFEPLPSPLGQETVTLFMDFSHWVTICFMSNANNETNQTVETEYVTDGTDEEPSQDVETVDGVPPSDPVAVQAYLESQSLTPTGETAVIQETDGVTSTYDCHGWTFSCGSTWINNDQVQKILDSNGYKPVDPTKVETNDIAVYRKEPPSEEEKGDVNHTGIVIYYAAGGDPETIRVESKWGAWGRYKHKPEQPVRLGYGPEIDYYRTTRKPETGAQDKEKHTLDTEEPAESEEE